jgi:DNA repair exonuclease SbcCD ATPase subunit
MNVIYHISDIHIRPGVYEDILYAINQLADLIKSENAKSKNKIPIQRQMVVIAGDVFENKNRVNSYDLDCFYKMLNILDFIKIVIIPGNHDFAVNDDLDLVTAAVKPYIYEDLRTKDAHVYMYNKSGVCQFPDFEEIDFHILSPMNLIIPDIRSGNFTIAILHEPINGCELYGSIVQKSARLNVEDLEKYNIVLCGDMHKQQYMGKNENIAYSGSLIQKNKGEDLKHGCIKWTIEDASTFNHEFIQFKLNTIYLILYGIDNVLNYPRKELYNYIKYVELRHIGCTKEKLDYFINKIQEKYRILNKVINMVEKKTTMGSDMGFDDVHTKILKVPNQITFLSKMLEDSAYKQEVLDLHNMLTSQLIGELKHRNKWKLNYLYWSNMFCYGENNFIDFRTLSGINSLIGLNRTGKSSIIDILIFILYNKLLRGDGKSIINHGCRKYKIVCSFSIKTGINVFEEYIIIRDGNNNAGNQVQELQLLKYEDTIWKNIREATIPQTYDIIKSLIGTYKDITSINISIQDNISIVNKKSDDQVAEFRKYFGLDKLEGIEKIINEELKTIKAQVGALNNVNSETEYSIDEVNKTKKIINKNQNVCRNMKRAIKKTHNTILELTKELYPDLPTILEIEESLSKLIIISEEQNQINENKLNNVINTLEDLRMSYIPSDHKLDDLENKLKLTLDCLSEYKDIVPVFQLDIIPELELTICNNNIRINELRNNLHPNISTTLEDVADLKYIPGDPDTLESVIQKNDNNLGELKMKVNIKLFQYNVKNLRESLEKCTGGDINELKNRKQQISEEIKKCKSEIEDTGYSLTQLNQIDPSWVLPDLKKSILSNTEILNNLRHEKSTITISGLSPCTKFDRDSIFKQIKDNNLENITIENLESQKYPICVVPEVKNPNISINEYNNLIKETRNLEIKYSIISKLNDNLSYLKFDDTCDCCSSNKYLVTGDPNILLNNLKNNKRLIKNYKDYEAWINMNNQMSHNEDINNKINLLKDRDFFENLIAKANRDCLKHKIKKLKTTQTELINSAKILEVKDAILRNDRLSKQIIQLKNKKKILQDDIELIQEYLDKSKLIQEVTINEEISTQIDTIEEQNKELRNQQASIIEYRRLLKIKNDLDENLIFSKEINELTHQNDNFSKIIKLIKDRSEIEHLIKENNRGVDIMSKINEYKNEKDILITYIENYKLYKQLSEKKTKVMNNEKNNTKISELNTYILNTEQNHNKIQSSLIKLSKNLEVMVMHNRISDNIRDLLHKQQIYDEYIRCINSKKGIPHEIVKQSCANIEIGINNILNEITDFNISLGFDLKKFNIMISDKVKSISTPKSDNIKSIPASQASGFQKFIIDMSMRLILASTHPYLPNILIIDEGFTALDHIHLANAKEFLEKLHRTCTFDWVIIISHLDGLNHISENRLEIKMTNDKSQLIVGKIPEFPEVIPNIVSVTDIYFEDLVNDPKHAYYCKACDQYFKNKENTKENHLRSDKHKKAVQKIKEKDIKKVLNEVKNLHEV